MTEGKRKAPGARRRAFRAKQPTLSCGLYPWQHRGLKGFKPTNVTSLLLLHLSLSASEAPQGKKSSRSTPSRGEDPRPAASHQHGSIPRSAGALLAVLPDFCPALLQGTALGRLSSLHQSPQGCVAACPGAKELLEARPGRGLAQVAPCSAELHRQPAPVGVYAVGPSR